MTKNETRERERKKHTSDHNNFAKVGRIELDDLSLVETVDVEVGANGNRVDRVQSASNLSAVPKLAADREMPSVIVLRSQTSDDKGAGAILVGQAGLLLAEDTFQREVFAFHPKSE
jgi:hypothetical protein